LPYPLGVGTVALAATPDDSVVFVSAFETIRVLPVN